MSTNKLLYGLGLIGAFSTGASTVNATEVKVYGKALASVANFSTSEADQSGTKLSTSGSRFGIKATEKINDMYTAFAKYEFSVDLTGAGTTIGNRGQYVGLGTTFGDIMMGFADTPYKKAKFELFGDTFADQNSLLSKGIERRGENMVGFKSKDYSGFSLYAQYSDSTQSDFACSNSYASVSLTYNMKPVKIMIAQDNISRGAASADDGTGTIVTTDYDAIVANKVVIVGTFGATKAGLTYEMIDDTTKDSKSDDRTNMALGVKHKMGEWELGLEHIMRGASAADNSKDEATQSSFAAKRHLSEKFSYYVLLSSLTNGEAGTLSPKAFPSDMTKGTAKEAYTTAGVGMVFKF